MGEKISKKNIFNMVPAVLAVVILYIIFFVTGIGCPIKFITGISCAGCGMTRAYLSLLHLDFREAFHYHPLFWLPPVFLVILYKKNRMKPSIYKILIYTIVVFFCIVYVYRLISNDDTVVVFRPQDNIVFRVIRLLKA